jgi:hypothetical protein
MLFAVRVLLSSLVVTTVAAGCFPQQQPPAPHLPEMYIDFTADREAAVLERRYRDGPWVPICGASCRRTVRPDYEYRVGGEGVVRSDPFVVHRPMRILAHPGERASRTLGIVGISIGTPVMLVGTFLTLLAMSRSSSGDDHSYSGPPVATSLMFFGLGAGLTIGGGLAVAANQTTVELAPRSPVAKLSLTF